MVTTLTGTNTFMLKNELRMRVQAFMAEYGDIAIERCDGEEATTDQMRAALQSMPFLSPRKLVVLREPSAQKTFAEAIADILKDIPETTDVVIYEPKLDKRSVYYKTLKKDTTYVECNDLDGPALSSWTVALVTSWSGKLTMSDAHLLIDRVGSSQEGLQHELEKLFAYNQHITKENIVLLTEETPQSTVFALLEAAFAGKTDRTFVLYKEQRALKVEPQAIIALLAWQLHALAVVKAGEGRSVDEIAREAKLNPFVVRKTQGLAKRLPLATLKQLVSDLLELDMQLKRSSIDADEALQLYLLKLSKV